MFIDEITIFIKKILKHYDFGFYRKNIITFGSYTYNERMF